MAKKLKDVVKTNPEPARGTVGVNPMDPWSAKSNIAEDGSLGKYLLSRGINPKFVSTDTKISHAKSSAFLKWKQDHQFEAVEHLDEDALLDKFLMSRGINPRYATKEMKISHSKSGQFIKWKNDHQFEEFQTEETDVVDTITVDIPLMIRLLELAREDVKDDMELHKITERLIEIRSKGTLSMEDYDFIANGKAKIKEEVEQIDEITQADIDKSAEQEVAHAKKHGWKVEKQTYGRTYTHPKHGHIDMDRYGEWQHRPKTGIYRGKGDLIAHGQSVQDLDKHISTLKEEVLDEAKTPRTTALEKWRKAATEREIKHNDIEKKRQEKLHQDPSKVTVPVANTQKDDLSTAIDHLEKHLNKEEVEQIDELKKSTMASYKDKSTASLKNAQANRDAAEPGKDMSKGFADLHAKSDKIAKKRVKGLIGYMQRKQGMKPTSEDVFQDPLAATQTVFDGGNNTNDTADRKSQLSKSAKMIKSLYKKLNMKEETYDWEKDDKSVQTYGKKPKIEKTEPDANLGEKKPSARIVMSGGKTLTGEKRDTVEIDPVMKDRPDLNGNVKTDQKQQNNK